MDSLQNVVCPSCYEWPCESEFEDCQKDLTYICEGCGFCPCLHTFEDCDAEPDD